jgi:FkbM family methyltransferase
MLVEELEMLRDPAQAVPIKEKFAKFGYELTKRKDGEMMVKSEKLALIGDAGLNTIYTSQGVLLRQEYDFFPTGKDKYLMIDIGLNIGLTTLHLASQENITRIYSFEPFGPTYLQAKRNLELNPELKKKITIYNFGLEDQARTATIAYNPVSPGSMSSITDLYKDEKKLRREKIILKKASVVLKPIIAGKKKNGQKKSEQKAEKIFLKIDCEGAELKILNDLATANLLKKVQVIILEYHNCGEDREIISLLNQQNFFCFIGADEKNRGMIKAVKINV